MDRLKEDLKHWIEEDVGEGDLTTLSTVKESVQAVGTFLAKAEGVVAGIDVVNLVFELVDVSLKVDWLVRDGDSVSNGKIMGTVKGSARGILLGERLALNLLQRMSGIATLARKMSMAAEKGARDCLKFPGHKCYILDTRKTAPGLRFCDKLAVKLGGAVNHRFGLYDMIMIKVCDFFILPKNFVQDNHVTAAGGISQAIKAAHEFLLSHGAEKTVQIEVETRTLDEVKEAVEHAGIIHRIMLDNMVSFREDGTMDTSMLEQAVDIIGGRVPTEASGNVTLNTVPGIAKCGVNYISSGQLTHSVTAMDISLKIKLST
jgi:nicotinate-nucleotide pyrophosphorylase (carboxylating)